MAMERYKTEQAKDWTPSDRAIVLALRLISGGRLLVHEVAAEFGIDPRSVYRDLEKLERHIPLCRERLDSGQVQYYAERFATGRTLPAFGRQGTSCPAGPF
jgi:predicted DNA-binding transcriptional regulator